MDNAVNFTVELTAKDLTKKSGGGKFKAWAHQAYPVVFEGITKETANTKDGTKEVHKVHFSSDSVVIGDYDQLVIWPDKLMEKVRDLIVKVIKSNLSEGQNIEEALGEASTESIIGLPVGLAFGEQTDNPQFATPIFVMDINEIESYNEYKAATCQAWKDREWGKKEDAPKKESALPKTSGGGLNFLKKK
jgi:hypothetical protein